MNDRPLALAGSMIPSIAGAALSKNRPAGFVEHGVEYTPNYRGTGFREELIADASVFNPPDALTPGDGYSPTPARARLRIAPVIFLDGGGSYRYGTDYEQGLGTFAQLKAAAEALSMQGDGRLAIGANGAAVGDAVTSVFDADETPLSLGFILRFSATSSSNVNPLAGQLITVTTAQWTPPWRNNASLGAVAPLTKPNRSVRITLDIDGLGKPIFVPWATQNYQKVRTTVALPGNVNENGAGVNGEIGVVFPTGLAAVSSFTAELVTCDHPDLDRVMERARRTMLQT